MKEINSLLYADGQQWIHRTCKVWDTSLKRPLLPSAGELWEVFLGHGFYFRLEIKREMPYTRTCSSERSVLLVFWHSYQYLVDFVIKSLLIIFSLTGCIQAVTLDVNEGNSTCIKADLLASFSITYNTSNGTVCKILETFYLNLGGKKEKFAPVIVSLCGSFSQRAAQFSLPDSATVDPDSSTCGGNSSSPWLVAVFGSGHALGLGFSTNGSLYSVANLTLQYNLSDASVFPDANSSGE